MQIHCNTSIDFISRQRNQIHLHSTSGQIFKGHELILGAGFNSNIELAEQAGLKVDNGIKVMNTTKHHTPTSMPLGTAAINSTNAMESIFALVVQNALDQAKNLAAHLCGETRLIKRFHGSGRINMTPNSKWLV